MSPRLRRLFLSTLFVSLSLAFGLGCAESDDDTRPVTYSLTAKQNYEKGMAELKDENYGEAKKYFAFVKQKFPFSKYAVMAELALADTQFAQGNYTEAIESYKSFARLHPTHEKVEDGYVAFRICEGYFKDMPEDIWIMPPSYEKDQSAVNDAARELAEFKRHFPDSPYTKKIDEMRKEVLRRLVEHEVYVARFYLKNDHPKAAANRIEGAIKKYPGSGREPELLYSLGETYLHMDDPLRAKETFTRVVTEYAGAPEARRSELYLEYITRRFGPHPPPKADDEAAPRRPRPMAEGEVDLRALVARGRAHYAAGENAQAVACLTEALRGKAAYADVYDMLGVIYHQEGRLPEAEEMFRTALQLNPGYTEAALNLVVTCNDLGKYAEAKAIYERAMAAVSRAPRELDPFVKGKIANMHAEVGATYRAVGAFDEAVREYGRALALCPGFADVRTELGKTLREMGDLPASIRELELVRAEHPRYPPGRIHLGLSYHAAGRRDDAAAQWRAVLEAEPDNKSAKMYLAMLEGPPPAVPGAGQPAK